MEGDSAVVSPNKPEAQQAIMLVVVLAKGVDRAGLEDGEGGCWGCAEDEEEEKMERRLSNFWWFNP